MRAIIIVAAAGVAVATSGAAVAQGARNTPEGIICAMTGSCDAGDTSGERVRVGAEKAFSLARPTSGSVTTAAPSAIRPSRTAVAAVAARPRVAPRRPVVAPKVQPGGGLDMLVTFKLGSAQLTPQAEAEARAFAQAMAAPQLAGMHFAIEGHTDSSGARDRNVALSQARAQSVVDYLVSRGVDPARLTAKGYGPDRPIRGMSAAAPGNRRVEFVKQL